MLENSALKSVCVLCRILYDGLCYVFEEYDGRMTRRDGSPLPDNLSFKVMQRKSHSTLIARLFWMITVDPVAKTYERAPESCELEFFTVSGA